MSLGTGIGRGLIALAALTLFVGSIASIAGARAQSSVAPSPKAVIYPGDIIGEGMLADMTLEASGFGGPFALSASDVIGKMARQTLLPGRPIPLRALDAPRLIRNGGEVKLVYVDGALTIVTSGSALQDGAVGDVVKVRNSDSGVTVSGQVQSDGSVRVNGG
jgi:flagella basal body P-ring formation protein FlgA